MGHTLESCRNGFCYDMHSEREIAVWEHIANVADQLCRREAKAFERLDRAMLTRLVVAVSSGVGDIPSEMPGVTDERVKIVLVEYEKR